MYDPHSRLAKAVLDMAVHDIERGLLDKEWLETEWAMSLMELSGLPKEYWRR